MWDDGNRLTKIHPMQDKYYIKYYRQAKDRVMIGRKEVSYLYLEMEFFFTDKPY